MIGTAEWFAEREEIYRDRNRRIEDVCNNLLKFSDTRPHLYESPTQGNSFWFDLSNHLAVCMHPKVRISYEMNMYHCTLSQLRLVAQHGEETCFSFHICQKNKKC